MNVLLHRIRLCVAPAVVLIGVVLLSHTPQLHAQAASTGTVVGRISNARTGGYLEGAVVSVNGTTLVTRTTRDGSYELANVPAGEQTLRVFYTALPVETKTVNVQAGRTNEASLSLDGDVMQLETFTVVASQVGEAASITKQRNADNVMNVVNMEAFGRVADGNIGNFMIRLPGIGGDLENGEVTGISIRGMPPAMNAINIDGVRTANALAGPNSMGDRAAQIDHIPAEFVKEIEIIKAPLPEHAADFIGGGVNLVTKSALDFDRTITTYRAGINHNVLRSDLKQYTPNAAFTVLTRVGPDRKLGVAFSGSYSNSISPRNRINMQRSENDGRNTQARTLANANDRTRIGTGLRFDYAPNDRTTLSFKYQYNYFKITRPRTELNVSVTGSRRVADYNVVSRAAIEAGAVPRDSSGQAAGVAPGFTESFTELLNATFLHAVTNNQANASQDLLELGGTMELDHDQTIIFQAIHNPTESHTHDEGFTARFTRPIGVSIDSTDRIRPKFLQTYGPSITYGSNMNLYTGQYQNNREHQEDTISNLKLDYVKDFHRDIPLQLKVGVHWREQDRTGGGRSSSNPYTYGGPDGVAGVNPASGINDDNIAQFLRLHPEYPVEVQGSSPWPEMNSLDIHAALRAVQEHPEWFQRGNIPLRDISSINEKVLGAYVQGRAEIKRLTVVGGVRFETTDVSATGRYTNPRDNSTDRITNDSEYDDLFPSLHFTYKIRPNVLGRLSYSTSMARPNMTDLYPVTSISYSGDVPTVTQNNTGLRPQFSKNFDASVEWYFEPAGVFSIGWFHKDITDFIARTTTIIPSGPDNGFDGDFAGADLITTQNLGKAKVSGLEINYNQNLAMLPKPFNGLSIFANYTYLKTSGTYNEGVSDLEGFASRLANAGLTYRWRKLQVSGTMNYTGDLLQSYNAQVYAQGRARPKTTYDASIQYTFNPRLAVFVDVANITDAWPVAYSGTDRSRVRTVDSYGTRYNVGITGRF
jgi:iron complex outermembrane receptor protein